MYLFDASVFFARDGKRFRRHCVFCMILQHFDISLLVLQGGIEAERKRGNDAERQKGKEAGMQRGRLRKALCGELGSKRPGLGLDGRR